MILTMAKIWQDGMVLIIPVVLVLMSYIIGDLAQMLFKVHRGIALKVLSGFVLFLCMFHVTSLPFMFNGASFSLLCSLFYGECAAVLLAYAILCVIRKYIPFRKDFKRLSATARSIAANRWWFLLLWGILGLLILTHVFFVLRCVGTNVDDNFYVAESLTFLSRDRMMDVLPSCGIEGSVFPATYLLVSWEAFLAALSKFFAVTPAAFCHSILPAFLIPLHYAAYYIAAREFSRKHASCALLFIVFLNITCGPSTYNQGAFLTLRIWQGKSVLVNILMPLLLYLFLRITKTKVVRVRNIFFLFAVLLASGAASTVGTYLAPVLYAVYALAFLIIIRKWKPFLQLFIPAGMILPFILWKVWLLFSAGTLADLSEGSGVYERSFTELLIRYVGFSLVPLFLVLALIILAVRLKKGPAKPLRFFFLIVTGIMIVFFLNPWMMPFTEHYVTGTGVYWRMFWLLQITLVVGIAFAELCKIPKFTLSRIAILVLLSVVILVSGRNIFKDEDVKIKGFKNPGKISKTTMGIAGTVENEIRIYDPEGTLESRKQTEQHTILMLPRELSDELRQVADLCLIYYIYYTNNYYAYQTEEEFYVVKALHNTLYSKKTWDPEELSEAVSYLGIDYVAIETPTVASNVSNLPKTFQPVFKNRRYILFKTNIAK